MLIAVQNEHEAELSAGTPGVGTSGAGTSGAGVTKSGTPQLTDQHFLQMIRDIFGGKFHQYLIVYSIVSTGVCSGDGGECALSPRKI